MPKSKSPKKEGPEVVETDPEMKDRARKGQQQRSKKKEDILVTHDGEETKMKQNAEEGQMMSGSILLLLKKAFIDLLKRKAINISTFSWGPASREAKGLVFGPWQGSGTLTSAQTGEEVCANAKIRQSLRVWSLFFLKFLGEAGQNHENCFTRKPN